MWRKIFLMIACVSFGPDALAVQQWDDDPTVADNLRVGVEDFLRARNEVARNTADFNARIIEARREANDGSANPQRHAEAVRKYADLMFAKDLYFADQFLYEGFTDTARRMEEGMPMLTGGKIDGGIPEDGREAFETWVIGLRKSLGAVGNQRLFKAAVKEESVVRALQQNQGLYEKYKVLRDQQDRNGGLSQRALAERKRLDDARNSADAARQADGSAGLSKQEVVPLDVNVWRVMLETPPLRKALFAAGDAGQQALRCIYGPSLNDRGEAVYGEYFFWYRTPPPNMAELAAMDTRGALRHLGRQGLAACPASKNAAAAQLQLAMASSGGTAQPAAGGKSPSPQCARMNDELAQLRGAAANDPAASARLRSMQRDYARQGCGG